MKTTATLTSKGQITIPQAVRQLLGLQTGDSVEFEVGNGRAEFRPVRPKRSSAGVLKRHLPQKWKPPTIGEMDSGIADALARRYRRK